MAEIGFGGGQGECRDMWSVMLRRVGLARIADHARRYNSLFKRQRTRRAWVLELDAVGTQPPSWPANLSWQRWRGEWLARLEAARAWLASPVVTCRADHYGGDCASGTHACDRPPAHWQRVNCGHDNAQAYWAIGPRVLRAEVAR